VWDASSLWLGVFPSLLGYPNRGHLCWVVSHCLDLCVADFLITQLSKSCFLCWSVSSGSYSLLGALSMRLRAPCCCVLRGRQGDIAEDVAEVDLLAGWILHWRDGLSYTGALPYNSSKQQNDQQLNRSPSFNSCGQILSVRVAVFRGRIPTSIAHFMLVSERYFSLILIVGAALILFNKSSQFLSIFAMVCMDVFHYLFLGFA